MEDETFQWRGEVRDAAVKKRGRPRGSKTRSPLAGLEAATNAVPESKRLPDVADMINSQLRLISAAQNQIGLDIVAGSFAVDPSAIRRITEISKALAGAVSALATASKAQDAVLARLSHAQHVEAAIRRLAEQEEKVIRYALRRLREALDGKVENPEPTTAAAAIAGLDE